ncbi:MAG: transposase, partial [Hyphomicrobiales bacterium]
MSGAFLAAVGATFENAAVTGYWFHVVQMFTKAVDDVRRTEAN